MDALSLVKRLVTFGGSSARPPNSSFLCVTNNFTRLVRKGHILDSHASHSRDTGSSSLSAARQCGCVRVPQPRSVQARRRQQNGVLIHINTHTTSFVTKNIHTRPPSLPTSAGRRATARRKIRRRTLTRCPKYHRCTMPATNKRRPRSCSTTAANLAERVLASAT